MTDISPSRDSYWRVHHPLTQQYPSLQFDHRSDVAIVGGGITGLSVALELLHRGLSVAVYEASLIGAGASGASAGHLDAHPEANAGRLVRKLGSEGAANCVNLRRAAISAMEYRAADRCDFCRIPAYCYAEDSSVESSLREAFDVAANLGLPVHWGGELPLSHASVGYRCDRMARMDSAAYVRRLADLVCGCGGKVFENTKICAVDQQNSTELIAGESKASFDHVVWAVHSSPDSAPSLQAQLIPQRTYALAARVSNPPPDALFWSNGNAYFHTRRAKSRQDDLIIVGGCDHPVGKGNPQDAEEQLVRYVRDRFDVQSIESQWSAEYYDSTDGLPIIGKLPGKPNAWIATGLSGCGLTMGTAAGWLLADQITNRPALLASEFSPSRFVGGQ